jgi:hypothetical protein
VADYKASRIHKRNYHSGASTKQPVREQPYVIGFDSEADTSSDGRPMLFQYSLPGTKEEDVILQEVPETKHAGLGCFLDFLDRYCVDAKTEYLLYVWNLTYEFTQLFHDLPKEVVNESEWTLTRISKRDGTQYPWTAHVSNDKRQLAEFVNGRVTVRVLDGTAFYKTSLAKAAKMLGVGEKYESGSVDRSLFTRRDLLDREFVTYAKRDAYITRLIGEYIQKQHDGFGIRTCISAPHFAATVFKTHFLHGPFTCPDANIEQAGLYSYHGGKNGYYLDGPAEFATIYNYDITSAYPEAMRQLPDVENSSWKAAQEYEPGQHGIYEVTLDYERCKYRGIQNHDGSWADRGRITVHTTSYELDEVLRQEEATIVSCAGYILLGKSGGALSDYVDKFFAVKSTSVGPERETAKLLLNSLYGKFFQKQPIGRVGNYDLDSESWLSYDDANESYDYDAGGLYNPPVASLITGYVRAKIHRLEHKYESVMTSTDGFFGIAPPDGADVGKSLGQLTVQRGRLRIWRERLYVFDGDDGKTKFALHGFHAGLAELCSVPLAKGEYAYDGRQMITLKMSTRDMRAKQYSPGQFVMMPFTLRI